MSPDEIRAKVNLEYEDHQQHINAILETRATIRREHLERLEILRQQCDHSVLKAMKKPVCAICDKNLLPEK